MANLKSMTIMWTTDVICILLIEMEKEALAYAISLCQTFNLCVHFIFIEYIWIL
jgi:Tfp pilus assembly ATPase PilU